MVWSVRCVWIVGCLTLFLSPSAHGQEFPSGRESVRVFMDCQASGCREPAVEYDVFPYDESSRRSLTFQYRIGFSSVDYDQVTVFDKREETLYEHSLTAG